MVICGGEELGDVAVFHADTTAGGGASKAFFMIRPMDIDVAVKGIDAGSGVVAGFASGETQDACEDEVFRSAAVPVGFGEDLAGGLAAFEDGAEGGVVTVTLDDFVQATRGLIGPFALAGSEMGGGNGVVFLRAAFLDQGEALVLYGNEQQDGVVGHAFFEGCVVVLFAVGGLGMHKDCQGLA